jgi:hypothetical protein
MSWDSADIALLKRLLRNRKLSAVDIAAKMGRTPECLRYKMNQLGYSPAARIKAAGTMGKWNSKHAHLHKKVLVYFLTHSLEETRKRFSLTASELKSLFTVAYRVPEFKHLRKDRRRHDPWTTDDYLFMLRAAGVQPRSWIARKLKRGSYHAVKDRIKSVGSTTRYINGLPLKLAEELLGKPINDNFKVNAGPHSDHGDFRCRLVPWVVLNSKAKRSKLPEHLKRGLSVMAKFQMNIHGTKTIKATVQNICNILRK